MCVCVCVCLLACLVGEQLLLYMGKCEVCVCMCVCVHACVCLLGGGTVVAFTEVGFTGGGDS